MWAPSVLLVMAPLMAALLRLEPDYRLVSRLPFEMKLQAQLPVPSIAALVATLKPALLGSVALDDTWVLANRVLLRLECMETRSRPGNVTARIGPLLVLAPVLLVPPMTPAMPSPSAPLMIPTRMAMIVPTPLLSPMPSAHRVLAVSIPPKAMLELPSAMLALPTATMCMLPGRLHTTPLLSPPTAQLHMDGKPPPMCMLTVVAESALAVILVDPPSATPLIEVPLLVMAMAPAVLLQFLVDMASAQLLVVRLARAKALLVVAAVEPPLAMILVLVTVVLSVLMIPLAMPRPVILFMAKPPKQILAILSALEQELVPTVSPLASVATEEQLILNVPRLLTASAVIPVVA